jgi:hypothetical protein
MTNGEEEPDERAEKLASRFSTPDTEETPQAQPSSDTSNASKTQESAETESNKASNTPSTSNSTQAKETSQMEETQETSQTKEQPRKRPVRELETKLLYLDDEFLQELELTFDELNLRYKREYGEELQKNRDYYPALLQLGLEQLGDVRDQDLAELEATLDL